MTRICAACGAEFPGHPPTTISAQPHDLCPACQQGEDREYANTTVLVADTAGRPYGRRAMQGRLGTRGEGDA